MINSTEQQKRDDLRNLLIELSSAQDLLKDNKKRKEYYRKLESIYYDKNTDNFRHYYSDIFAALTFIDSDMFDGNLDILAQNMQVIKEGYYPKNFDENGCTINIEKEINKLYDHTNLDIARINYTKRFTSETESKLMQNESLINTLQSQQQKSDKERENAFNAIRIEADQAQQESKKNQEKMQTEYITILGIFASIVLAFTGGMTFSTSVLENISSASIYRTTVISLILGLILFNLIWLLIDFLREINGKNIRKWWIIIVTDSILCLGILFSFISYKNHWLENKKEDTKIEINSTESESTDQIIPTVEPEETNTPDQSTEQESTDQPQQEVAATTDQASSNQD